LRRGRASRCQRFVFATHSGERNRGDERLVIGFPNPVIKVHDGADLAQIMAAALELKRRRAAWHVKTLDLGEPVQPFLCKPVGEMRLIRIVRYADEGKDGAGQLGGGVRPKSRNLRAGAC
jgi:hypothetical protein